MPEYLTGRVSRALATAIVPLALSGCVTVMGAVHPASSRAELRHFVDSLTTQTEFRNATWGVLIVNPRTGDTLYSKNAGKLIMPASNKAAARGKTSLLNVEAAPTTIVAFWARAT